MKENIKMIQLPCLDKWSMLLTASKEQFQSLVLESKIPCVSSNIALEEKINLPTITDWLYP